DYHCQSYDSSNMLF
nr:immunoglobulin light chain junction region [Macaca mulatta]